MLLRVCREEDLPRILEIERRAMQAYYEAGFTFEEVLPRTEEDLRFLIQKTNVVLAVDETDMPQGYISYFLIGSFLHLEDQVVHPAVQTQGIGRLLFQHFLEVGQALENCKYYSLFVFKEAIWAYEAYRRAGFKVTTPIELELLSDDALKRMLDVEQSQYPRSRIPMLKLKSACAE